MKNDQQFKYRKGQRVEYSLLWAGGRDPSEHLRSWIPGFVVVEPVSPYAKGCALIKHESSFRGVPFSAEYGDIRPLNAKE